MLCFDHTDSERFFLSRTDFFYLCLCFPDSVVKMVNFLNVFDFSFDERFAKYYHFVAYTNIK